MSRSQELIDGTARFLIDLVEMDEETENTRSAVDGFGRFVDGVILSLEKQGQHKLARQISNHF